MAEYVKPPLEYRQWRADHSNSSLVEAATAWDKHSSTIKKWNNWLEKEVEGSISVDTDRSVLNTEQVAELLGMNVQMVRRYAREGRLPAYRIPGLRPFKFFRDEILEVLRSYPLMDG